MSTRLATLAGLTLLLATTASAEELRIEDPWVRAAPPTSKVMAGFMTIVNESSEAVEVTGASSPSFGMVEMHRTEIRDGIARMLEQKKLTVEAAGRLTLAPGGYHLMLMMPNQVPQVGEQVELTLELADGQTKTIMAPVERR